MTRVAVLIDYENSRFGAREVFGDPRRDPYTFGHVERQKRVLMLKQLDSVAGQGSLHGDIGLGLDGDYVDASIAGGGEDGQVAVVRGDDLVAVVS